ncbi:MAG: protein-export chaperone SecB [Rickettsiales bacterium]|nr:protein-export chaperone SecB [Rickettsiales bacterium]
MAKFNLMTQFVKDFSFESPNAPELFFKQEDTSAKMEINFDLQVKGTENDLYMVDVITKLHSKLDKDSKTIFMIELVYSGLVHAEKGSDEEDLKRTLMIDVPAMLFPAIRALVLRVTSESGFPPFALQPVDWKDIYENKAKESK